MYNAVEDVREGGRRVTHSLLLYQRLSELSELELFLVLYAQEFRLN